MKKFEYTTFVFNTNKREFDIKSKDSKLPVIDKININGGFLFKETVCCNSGQRVSNEIVEGTVSGVFYLCYVLQFIIDSFNQSSFSKQNLVGNKAESCRQYSLGNSSCYF